ncbi:ABC transporter ATP-binding protein [Cytobacillus praedii]|uniref:ABC transporter ATP-binding protein n=1 Tax=Cytobacillus praedii TaxID=1742358 RepID=UPI003F7F5096
MLPASKNPYRFLFKKYLKGQYGSFSLLTFLIIFNICLGLVIPQIMKRIIDTALVNYENQLIIEYTTIFIIVTLLSLVTSVFSKYIGSLIGITSINRLRNDLVSHVVNLEMTYHNKHRSGEMIERINGDVSNLKNFFSHFLILLVSNSLLIVGILFIMFTIDWRLGLVMSAFTGFALSSLYKIRNIAVPFWTSYQEISSFFYGFIGEQINGKEDIKANGALKYISNLYRIIVTKWKNILVKAGLASSILTTTATLIFSVGIVISLLSSSYLWSKGSITIGSVYMIFQYTSMLTKPIDIIKSEVSSIQIAIASIKRILSIFSIKQEESIPHITQLPDSPIPVRFENVRFGYENGKDVIKNISFQLPQGKSLGIIGETGSGKTSLVKLLLRLYNVREGNIYLANRNITDFNIGYLRKNIGFVTQEVVVFKASVRDNITLFETSIKDETITSTLTDIGLSNWINNLPQGLDTIIDKNSSRLSAGEAQLFSMSRSLLSNKNLIILDEPSSRIDSITQKRVNKIFNNRFKGKTSIIIAHKIETLEMVDYILVIRDGETVEFGKRDILLSNNQSEYYKLVKSSRR